MGGVPKARPKGIFEGIKAWFTGCCFHKVRTRKEEGPLSTQLVPLPEDDVDVPFDPEQVPDHCVLTHHVFSRLPDISFRRAGSDGTPVMVVPFGDRTVSVPLRSLQREFAIQDASADGHMLGLIAASLDYVTALHLGDKLPDEVVNGKASWEPGVLHRRRAATRLRLRLLAWLDPSAALAAGKGEDSANRLEADPELRTMVQTAFRKAAEELGLATSEELVERVEQLAEEFSYIEALREGLLNRVQAVVTVYIEFAGMTQVTLDYAPEQDDPLAHALLDKARALNLVAATNAVNSNIDML